MASTKDRKIQYSEYGKHFTDQVQNADTARGQAIERLQKIRVRRQQSQERQLGRLAEKYGGQHPRTERHAKRIAGEIEMQKYLSLSIDKTKDDSDIIKDSFVLKGRILADNVKGLAGHTVQLQDSRKNVVGKPVKTDKDGFYSLVIDVDESLNTKKLDVVVLDKEGIQIHREKLPVVVNASTVEPRDIVLSKVGKIDRGIKPIVNNVRKPTVPVARKKITKKVVRKVAKKTPAGKVAKKVTKKTEAKKVLKKVTKKISKAPTRKVTKAKVSKKVVSRKKKSKKKTKKKK